MPGNNFEGKGERDDKITSQVQSVVGFHSRDLYTKVNYFEGTVSLRRRITFRTVNNYLLNFF